MQKYKLLPMWVLIGSLLLLSTANCSDETTTEDGVIHENGQKNDSELNIGDHHSSESGDTGAEAGEKGANEAGYDDLTAKPNKNNQQMTWQTYVNSKYAFRLNYPSTFVTKPQDLARLAGFTPLPVASIFFMNPTMANGNLAGIEPPDLEVRVYHSGEVESLRSWLDSVGFASAESGTTSRPYQNSNVKGLEVCQTTMITPGCSIFILGARHVYQLTAMTREGEVMIQTFQPGS